MRHFRNIITLWLFTLCASSAFAVSTNDAVKATAALNARSTASTTASIVATIPQGTVGTIDDGPTTANSYTWWHLLWNSGQSGWSIQDYLVLNTPSPKSFSTGSGVQVATYNTNTRIAASTTASIVALMPIGSTGTVSAGPTFANGYAWWRINWSSGQQGWSIQDYLMTYTPPTVTSVSVTCSPSMIEVNQTSQCNAVVSGIGSYSNTVNWSTNVGAVNASGLFFAPSTVPNPAQATVTAVSVQTPSKSGSKSVQITASTPTWSQSNPNVYLDATGSGWYIEQWAGVTNNSLSPTAHSGDFSVETKTFTQWGRIQFTSWANYRFNTSGYDSVSFWLNIGTYENEVLYIGLLNSSLVAIQYVDLATVPSIGKFHSYGWKLVTIPLSMLGASNTIIYGVEFQSATPATWNIDELKFNQNGVCSQ